MEFKNFNTTSISGAALPGATVNVYETGTVTPVTIYDESGSVLSALVTDSTGKAGFAALNGAYDVAFTLSGSTTTLENEQFFDPLEAGLPNPDASLLHWGCTTGTSLAGADSQPDDASKVQAAVDYCIANLIGELHWPAGYINCGSTINVDGRLVIKGAGPRSSYIHANHTTGAAIRFKNRDSGLLSMGVTAGATRRAAAIGGNRFGVQFEDDDITELSANRVLHCMVRDSYIYGHPDNLIHIVGPAFSGDLTNISFATTKRHAIHIERGEVSGRSNLVASLIALGSIDDCRFSDIAGHLVACGSSTDAYSTPALRVWVRNCEGSGGLDRSVMYADAACYFRGAEHRMDICGFGHPNAQAFIAGRDMHFTGARALNNGTENTFDPSTAVDTGTETITITAHGFQDDYKVLYLNGTGTDIGGLTDNTEYYVINKTDDTFQLSATEGGAAINLTSTGTGTDHTLTHGGCVFIIGTYDELPTQNIHINGLNAISPERNLDPAILVTLPSGETTEPQGIFVNNAKASTVTSLIGTDSTMGSGGASRVPGLIVNGKVPRIVKTADQIVNNSTSVVTDTDLQYWLYANETAYFHAMLRVDSAIAADFRAQFVDPAGATLEYAPVNSMKLDSTGSALTVQSEVASGVITWGSGGTGNVRYIEFRGRVVNGSTAGLLRLQWAQLTADASDTTVKAGSWMQIDRIEP